MFLRNMYPALLWALLILILCAIPGNDLSRLKFLDWMKPDKIVHLFLFGVLSVLLFKSFKREIDFTLLQSYPVISAVVISSMYGIVIELLQEFVFVYRSGEGYDVLADAAGAITGLWLYHVYLKRTIVHSHQE